MNNTKNVIDSGIIMPHVPMSEDSVDEVQVPPILPVRDDVLDVMPPVEESRPSNRGFVVSGWFLVRAWLAWMFCLVIVASVAIFLWFVLPYYLPQSFFDFWEQHWLLQGIASLGKSYLRDVFLVGICVAFVYQLFWMKDHFAHTKSGWCIADTDISKGASSFRVSLCFLNDAYDLLTPPVRKSIFGRVKATFFAVRKLHRELTKQDLRHKRDLKEIKKSINELNISLQDIRKCIDDHLKKEGLMSKPIAESDSQRDHTSQEAQTEPGMLGRFFGKLRFWGKKK